MAASFILLLLPILRRRRRNKPDSLVNRRPLQKRVVRVNASVVLVQGRWALESDLALEFFYVRFAQLVVLSCTQREEREREREESRVSRTRARVHTKRIQKHSKQRERRHHHHHHHQKEGERAKHDARTNEPSSRVTKKFFFFFFFFFLIFNPYLLLSVFRCHLNARRTSIEHRMEAKKWATQL